VGVEPVCTAVSHGTTPHPDPPPAETAYMRVSATQQSDRNRQQPISIGGRGYKLVRQDIDREDRRIRRVTLTHQGRGFIHKLLRVFGR
jgi:hypothetical protein